MMKKQKTKAIAMIFSMLLLFICMYNIKTNAMDVTSATYEGVTYTGSITYYGAGGPSGYYELVLKASATPNELYEYVKLKSGSGSDKDPISGIARNSKSLSLQTPVFVSNAYTTKGYFFYSVVSSSGQKYTFSSTRQ
ncbi:MAG: hypothetical protein NC240_09395 [Clostridium sp.]|nr:hypothetical protein [Clostridium sp.]